MEILRYAAFTTVPTGGNPAGVVLDASGATDDELQRSRPRSGTRRPPSWSRARTGTRCATSARSPRSRSAGTRRSRRPSRSADRGSGGTLRFGTMAGPVEVRTSQDEDGRVVATLISVPPRTVALVADRLAELLSALGWSAADLDAALPPRVAYAGAWHPVLAVRTRERLADLDYDFGRLGALMRAHDWTTVALVHRESPGLFHARNPFPPGGVREDPATGAAAAAFGGYLRELGLVDPPATITVRQGDDLGRPGVLTVGIPAGSGGIEVSGNAVQMP